MKLLKSNEILSVSGGSLENFALPFAASLSLLGGFLGNQIAHLEPLLTMTMTAGGNLPPTINYAVNPFISYCLTGTGALLGFIVSAYCIGLSLESSKNPTV